MPTNNAQWAFFLFFAIGALGGWMLLGMMALDFLAAARLRRDIELSMRKRQED